MASANTKHIISFKPNVAGNFDVLTNGFSYAIHRNLSRQRALERATEIRRWFITFGEKATIRMDKAISSAPQTLGREPVVTDAAEEDRPGHPLSK